MQQPMNAFRQNWTKASRFSFEVFGISGKTPFAIFVRISYKGMPFKFAGNAADVDEDLKKAVRALNEFNKDDYLNFCTAIMETLSPDRQASDGDLLISEIYKKTKFEKPQDEATIKKIIESILVIINGGVKYNVNDSSLSDDLINLGLTDEKYRKMFSKMYKRCYYQLNRSAIDASLRLNQVIDMKWKFGVTASSNALGSVGTTYLQLQLVLLDLNNNTQRVTLGIFLFVKVNQMQLSMSNLLFNTELSLPQFYSFLKEMEKAKLTMESVE
ncbi:hypothetical protein RFI_07733 [Reticulomyxa filosa]|uniref:COMM domain-containing protein n=1 Tax=Reticulomyxa filosa TaxID=46433 RepID=X6NT01_RETFI|nr:hypothetical protein RFI_07733 [Reticulomyxa filosa]|eukprot:ETO29390.1 hypothetical protein RFI_07733 [Reticulomyxa filosa]